MLRDARIRGGSDFPNLQANREDWSDSEGELCLYCILLSDSFLNLLLKSFDLYLFQFFLIMIHKCIITGRTTSFTLEGQRGCDHCWASECDGWDEKRPRIIGSLQGINFSLSTTNFNSIQLSFSPVSRIFSNISRWQAKHETYCSRPPVSPPFFLVGRPSENSMRPHPRESARIASWR